MSVIKGVPISPAAYKQRKESVSERRTYFVNPHVKYAGNKTPPAFAAGFVETAPQVLADDLIEGIAEEMMAEGLLPEEELLEDDAPTGEEDVE